MSAELPSCAACAPRLRGLPDLCFRLPDEVFALSEHEREERALSSSDLCVVDDERHFLRAVLPMPIRGTDEEYCFGVWVRVERSDFERYVEHFDEDPPAGEGPYVGRLGNAVPGLSTEGLAARVHLQPDNRRPRVEVEPADHALARRQRDGIALAELLRILGPYL